MTLSVCKVLSIILRILKNLPETSRLSAACNRRLIKHRAETGISYQRDFCLALYRAGPLHLVKAEFDRVFQSAYQGQYESYKSYFLSGGIYNVFLLWLLRDCAESPEEMAEKLEGILVKGDMR